MGHRIALTDLRHRQTHTGLDTDYVNHNIQIRIFKWTLGHPTTILTYKILVRDHLYIT